MEKYINEAGKECYSGVTENTPVLELEFHKAYTYESDIQYALHTNLGSLTVLDRMTGFGCRDVETGYRSPEGKFWLASGNCDVRISNAQTVGDAITWVKERANLCTGQ